jgi:hypothetical protein
LKNRYKNYLLVFYQQFSDQIGTLPRVGLEPRSGSSGFILFDFNLRKLNLKLPSKYAMGKDKGTNLQR